MTQIIAVANEKGGVAKTTTSISLGGALVKLGQDVLLVDLDPQSNLSIALGLPTPQNTPLNRGCDAQFCSSDERQQRDIHPRFRYSAIFCRDGYG